jgi:ankyrin repeat protein
MAALHRTAYIGLVEATRLLLDARADVNNTRTAMHRSPLCLAAGELGTPAPLCVPVADSRGDATRLRRDRELLDRLPSCRRESASSRIPCIVCAAKLLLEHGADPDIASTHNGGPLHRAGIYKHPTLWHLLVASGANVDAKDDQGAGHSVLHGGASNAHLQA